MTIDLEALYALMLKSRLFEAAVAALWQEGLISGEMHLGTGEEAVIAGVVSQLQEGDAMALDHRATAALLMHGVDPRLMLREMLGQPDGLCGGMGGHMHLFSKKHLAASSGIVGAAGPAALGFALSAQFLRPGCLAVAFFGDGAMNQGMLMESLNLAAVWKLPVLFVCKDDGWAVTTRSGELTGGGLSERARAFGLLTADVDGRDVRQVWHAAHEAIERARAGGGPGFLHATCVHFEGHFLGFGLIRAVREPLREMTSTAIPLVKSLLRPRGAPLRQRLAGMRMVNETLNATQHDPRNDPANDPLQHARLALQIDPADLLRLEDRVQAEIDRLLELALVEVAI